MQHKSNYISQQLPFRLEHNGYLTLNGSASPYFTMLIRKQRDSYAPYQFKRSDAQNRLQENGNLLMG